MRYEDIVTNPEKEARKILNFLGLSYEDQVVNYGRVKHQTGNAGDPLTAHKEGTPKPGYAIKWVTAYRADPMVGSIAASMLSGLKDAELELYGFPRPKLFDPLHDERDIPNITPPKKHHGGVYQIQRRIFLALRWLAGKTVFRKLLEGIRYYCDLILRN